MLKLHKLLKINYRKILLFPPFFSIHALLCCRAHFVFDFIHTNTQPWVSIKTNKLCLSYLLLLRNFFLSFFFFLIKKNVMYIHKISSELIWQSVSYQVHIRMSSNLTLLCNVSNELNGNILHFNDQVYAKTLQMYVNYFFCARCFPLNEAKVHISATQNYFTIKDSERKKFKMLMELITIAESFVEWEGM